MKEEREVGGRGGRGGTRHTSWAARTLRATLGGPASTQTLSICPALNGRVGVGGKNNRLLLPSLPNPPARRQDVQGLEGEARVCTCVEPVRTTSPKSSHTGRFQTSLPLPSLQQLCPSPRFSPPPLPPPPTPAMFEMLGKSEFPALAGCTVWIAKHLGVTGF